MIDRAMRDDPEAAEAEWNAQFRSDIDAVLDDGQIMAAVDMGRPRELPPRSSRLSSTHRAAVPTAIRCASGIELGTSSLPTLSLGCAAVQSVDGYGEFCVAGARLPLHEGHRR